MLRTKQKLMATAMMLVVSMLMMTSASFAWFTISTNPEITGATTQVVTNENLEIALSDSTGTEPSTTSSTTGDHYTYGNLIDFSSGSDADSDAVTAYAALDTTLRPATDTSLLLQYPTYGTDGRVDDLDDLDSTASTDGFGNLIDADGLVYGYYIEFWMRSNVGGEVELVDVDTLRSSEGVKGLGSVYTPDQTLDSTVVESLAAGIRLAFEEVSDCTAATSVTPDSVLTGDYTTDDTISDFTGLSTGITLTANTDTLIRMYVYLDGTAIGNEVASVGTDLVTGALNVQFGIDEVGTSMDDSNLTTVSS